MPAFMNCSRDSPERRLDAQHDRIGNGGDIGLGLPANADAFHDHLVIERAEQGGCRKDDIGEPAKPSARGDGADKHAVVLGVGAHAHAVAQERAAACPRGGVDGHHGHGLPGGAPFGDERIDERGLAGAGRAGDADDEAFRFSWASSSSAAMAGSAKFRSASESAAATCALPVSAASVNLGPGVIAESLYNKLIAGQPRISSPLTAAVGIFA